MQLHDTAQGAAAPAGSTRAPQPRVPQGMSPPDAPAHPPPPPPHPRVAPHSPATKPTTRLATTCPSASLRRRWVAACCRVLQCWGECAAVWPLLAGVTSRPGCCDLVAARPGGCPCTGYCLQRLAKHACARCRVLPCSLARCARLDGRRGVGSARRQSPVSFYSCCSACASPMDGCCQPYGWLLPALWMAAATLNNAARRICLPGLCGVCCCRVVVRWGTWPAAMQ
jgi:hypothetical protein